MPVEVSWYLPHHVLLTRFYGNVVVGDIQKQATLGTQMAEAVNTPLVHMIVDITEVKSFPKNIIEYKDSLGEKAKNSGWIVLVGEHKIMRFIGSVLTNAMKLRFAYVNTHDEAVEYITTRDPYLDFEEALDATIPYGEDGI